MTVVSDKPEFPKTPSSSSTSGPGWDVEVRTCKGAEPFALGEQLITSNWKKANFESNSPIGVPCDPGYLGAHRHYNLYSYAAAQALRWWLHAQAEADIRFVSNRLETRLVEYKVTAEFTCTAVAEHCNINPLDRSSTMPNWGVKPAVEDKPPVVPVETPVVSKTRRRMRKDGPPLP